MTRWPQCSASVLLLLSSTLLFSEGTLPGLPAFLFPLHDELLAAARLMRGRNLSVSSSHLDGFTSPLRQTIQAEQIRIPGVPRPYRNGIHQGIDFYGLDIGAVVHPVQEGVVLRIDHNYRPLDPEFRAELLRLTRARWRGTPGSVRLPPAPPPYGDVLDQLMGRQVWIYHGTNDQGNSVITRYGHLSSVNQRLQRLDHVDPLTSLGVVGHSGTSSEGTDSVRDTHLHLEIYVGDRFWHPQSQVEIGQPLAPERKRALREKTLRLLPEWREP